MDGEAGVFPFVAENPRPKPSSSEAPDFAGQWRNQRGSVLLGPEG